MSDVFVLVEIDPSTGRTIAVLRTYESSRRADEDLDLLRSVNNRHFKVVTAEHIDS